MTIDEITTLVSSLRAYLEERLPKPIVVSLKHEEGGPVLVVYTQGVVPLKKYGGLPLRVEGVPPRDMKTSRWVVQDEDW